MSSSPDWRRRKKHRRVAVLFAAVALGILVPARPAAAHAVLVSSEPANGTTVGVAPGSVVLRFSEDVSPRFSSARLVDGAGRTVAGTRLRIDGPRTLRLELPRLGAGTYGALWRVLAEDDGHPTSGVVVFGVGLSGGAPAFAPAAAGTAADPVDVLRRWLGLGALAGLIGGLAVALVVLRRQDAVVVPARRRVLGFAAWCAGTATVLAVVDLVVQGRRVGATGPGDLLAGTRWGQLWLTREAALVGLTAITIALWSGAARSGARGRPLWMIAGALVLVTVSVEALGSHAAALDPGRVPALVADAMHILTACVWLGAVASLAVLLWPRRRGATAGVDGRAALVHACRDRFATLAFASLGLVVVTGLYNAGRQVDVVDGLVTTGYGRALLAKGGLLAVIGGLAMANVTRLRAAPAHRLVAAEAAVGAVLLVAAGILAESTPARSTPARGPVYPAEQAAPVRTGGGVVDDLVVSLSATPNRPGVNGFTVLATSSRRPAPAPIDAVAVELDTGGVPSTVDLEPVEAGRYFGTVTLATTGPVGLAVVVTRAGKRTTIPVDWSVDAPASPARTQRGTRLEPVVNGLALLLVEGLVAAGVWWYAVARRRRRGRPSMELTASGQPVGERVLEGIR
jgi:copper transport protein